MFQRDRQAESKSDFRFMFSLRLLEDFQVEIENTSWIVSLVI